MAESKGISAEQIATDGSVGDYQRQSSRLGRDGQLAPSTVCVASEHPKGVPGATSAERGAESGRALGAVLADALAVLREVEWSGSLIAGKRLGEGAYAAPVTVDKGCPMCGAYEPPLSQDHAPGCRLDRAIRRILGVREPGRYPARLDLDGTEKPLTRIVAHAKEGDYVGPGAQLTSLEHVSADGTRTPLAASGPR